MAKLRHTALYEALLEDTNDAFSGINGKVKQVAATQLRNSFLKKYQEGSSSSADAAALLKFTSINERCKTWSPVENLSMFTPELVGHLKVELHKFFEPNNRQPLVSTANEILHLARVGPGAAVGAVGNDSYSKLFSSSLSCTTEFLYASYANYVNNSPLWSMAENLRKDLNLGHDIVDGNRVSCVPKNVDISRVICIEPNLNMFFQLGLGEIMTRRLKSVYSIDLSSQPVVNRELARVGSLNGDLCTIDLESASDSMSLLMLKHVMPRDIYLWLSKLRSRVATLPDGSKQELHMVSTMGNGFTFPLQTILFSCVVSACFSYLGLRGHERAGKTWSVFGDDIIVPLEIVGAVLELLTYLGFTVNTQKSFFEGPFRESCGHDYFLGSNVRGVYIKTLVSPQSRCAAINLLNRWSASNGILLPKTVQMLLKTVRYQPVPPWENDDAGLKVPFDLAGPLRSSKRFQSVLYRRYVSVPRKIVIADGIIKTPRGLHERVYNPHGLLWAFLNGTIVNGKINVRHNVSLYRSTTGVAPSWDHSDATPWSYDLGNLSDSFLGAASEKFRLKMRQILHRRFVQEEFDWPRWRTAVRGNFRS